MKAKTAASTPPPAGIKKSTAREYFESLCVAVILALFVRTFVVQAFKIPTGSMENNLLIGDHLLVNKMVFAPTLTGFERAFLPADPIRRGDIIVFIGAPAGADDAVEMSPCAGGAASPSTSSTLTVWRRCSTSSSTRTR